MIQLAQPKTASTSLHQRHTAVTWVPPRLPQAHQTRHRSGGRRPWAVLATASRPSAPSGGLDGAAGQGAGRREFLVIARLRTLLGLVVPSGRALQRRDRRIGMRQIAVSASNQMLNRDDQATNPNQCSLFFIISGEYLCAALHMRA